MSRLIDADALMDDINELKKSRWYNNDINGSRVVRSEVIDIVQMLCIDNAPTIDAVEVVRCKDCKHYESDGGAIMICNITDMVGDDDDYCSYGVREEGE